MSVSEESSTSGTSSYGESDSDFEEPKCKNCEKYEKILEEKKIFTLRCIDCKIIGSENSSYFQNCQWCTQPVCESCARTTKFKGIITNNIVKREPKTYYYCKSCWQRKISIKKKMHDEVMAAKKVNKREFKAKEKAKKRARSCKK